MISLACALRHPIWSSKRAAVLVGNARRPFAAVNGCDRVHPLRFRWSATIPSQPASWQSLTRPGGNITGFTFFERASLPAKRLELLLEILPQGRRVGALIDPGYLAG